MRANMDDGSPPEREYPSKLRELVLICGLAAIGTVGTVWVGWEIGGLIP
jgi:hypothetical protein